MDWVVVSEYVQDFQGERGKLVWAAHVSRRSGARGSLPSTQQCRRAVAWTQAAISSLLSSVQDSISKDLVNSGQTLWGESSFSISPNSPTFTDVKHGVVCLMK